MGNSRYGCLTAPKQSRTVTTTTVKLWPVVKEKQRKKPRESELVEAEEKKKSEVKKKEDDESWNAEKSWEKE